MNRFSYFSMFSNIFTNYTQTLLSDLNGYSDSPYSDTTDDTFYLFIPFWKIFYYNIHIQLINSMK